MTFYISPYRRFATLRQAMDRLMDESLPEEASNGREMMLAVNVTAGDEDYVIKAFVPGLAVDDLNIEMLNNTVSLRGEFKTEEGEQKYLASELPAGAFSRVITLPTALDAGKAEASLKDGLLTLRIPKAEAHRPRTIKISNN